jgi:hypothetical protein
MANETAAPDPDEALAFAPGAPDGRLSEEPRADADAEAEDLGDRSSSWWARGRNSLRVPGVLVRLALYDPAHIPERLTIYSVDKQADSARSWAQRVREAEPETPVAVLAETQRRRTVSTARIDGAVAGTPFFIALVPAYIAFLRQEVRFHLRVAALYGEDPADPGVAADFLVLRGVHKDSEKALAELDVVRANPLPPHHERTPLKSWYEAVVSILVLAGFMQAPEENGPTHLTAGQKVLQAVRFVVAAAIWVLTWVVPITFMIVMSWACESDARRFGQRVMTRYADDNADIAVAMARADRKAGGNRAVTFARGALVVASVALPLALIASTVLAGSGPLGVQLPEAAAALVALALVIGVSAAAIRG